MYKRKISAVLLFVMTVCLSHTLGQQYEDTKLLPPQVTVEDRFGYSVSISGDVAVVGAYFDDDLGTDSGAVYVFRYDSGNAMSMCVGNMRIN